MRVSDHAPPAVKKQPLAVIIPLRANPVLSPEETISLRHVRHFLAAHDVFLLLPQGTTLGLRHCREIYAPRRFFGSAAAHARLLSSPWFYRRFRDYRMLMFYHLDSLVFSSDVEPWLEMPYDYIGAPWLRCDDSPWVKKNRVGNGGFALLRVDAALRVLRQRHLCEPRTLVLDAFTHHASPPLLRWMSRLEQPTACPSTLRQTLQRVARTLMDEWRATETPAPNHRNNDVFWSDFAPLYDPSFRVAPFSAGLSFAYEVAPRICHELNHGKLPLGCHAWHRYDRAFWEPLLLPA